MNRSMRNIEPLAIPFGIDALEPYRKPASGRIPDSALCDILSISDCDIPVHLDLHGIEIAYEILLVRDPRKETLLIVSQHRLTASNPNVPVNHDEVG